MQEKLDSGDFDLKVLGPFRMHLNQDLNLGRTSELVIADACFHVFEAFYVMNLSDIAQE